MATSDFTAALGQQQFLNLFVTQLRYQDPLEPTGQQDFLQQLAQFSTVEGIEKLNSQFGAMATSNSLADGVPFLGQQVRTIGSDSIAGRVDEVVQSGGQILANIQGLLVPISDITAVVNLPPE